jgi:glycosyltransferase involved in cell wall biosynthesis
VFFQLNNTGIARVWTEILSRWQETPFGERLVVLDRHGTLPKLSKLRTLRCSPLSYDNWHADRAVVQKLCDAVGARLFVSTYYTRAEQTPSVLLIHDMIPERFFDTRHPRWQQKHDAIRHASAFAAVSKNTLADLRRFFPETANKPAIISSPGVSSTFVPPSAEERRLFHARITLPYLGGRPFIFYVGEILGYKNAALLLRALRRMPVADRRSLGLLFTHKGGTIDDFYALEGLKVHAARLTDAGLRAAYGSALALIYPSRYEGFGLPPLEAMACGCPVICSDTSSLPEVVGDAALLIDPEDDEDLYANLLRIQDAGVRDRLRAQGISRAANFSFDKMAGELQRFLAGLNPGSSSQ